jgi:hypothetical protein
MPPSAQPGRRGPGAKSFGSRSGTWVEMAQAEGEWRRQDAGGPARRKKGGLVPAFLRLSRDGGIWIDKPRAAGECRRQDRGGPAKDKTRGQKPAFLCVSRDGGI